MIKNIMHIRFTHKLHGLVNILYKIDNGLTKKMYLIKDIIIYHFFLNFL